MNDCTTSFPINSKGKTERKEEKRKEKRKRWEKKGKGKKKYEKERKGLSERAGGIPYPYFHLIDLDAGDCAAAAGHKEVSPLILPFDGRKALLPIHRLHRSSPSSSYSNRPPFLFLFDSPYSNQDLPNRHPSPFIFPVPILSYSSTAKAETLANLSSTSTPITAAHTFSQAYACVYSPPAVAITIRNHVAEDRKVCPPPWRRLQGPGLY